jgi:hypothetical protein
VTQSVLRIQKNSHCKKKIMKVLVLCFQPNIAVWLNSYQSLGNQGLSDDSYLIFKKKFHYNDAFVNTNDPVYFNLLFCQVLEFFI